MQVADIFSLYHWHQSLFSVIPCDAPSFWIRFSSTSHPEGIWAERDIPEPSGKAYAPLFEYIENANVVSFSIFIVLYLYTLGPRLLVYREKINNEKKIPVWADKAYKGHTSMQDI